MKKFLIILFTILILLGGGIFLAFSIKPWDNGKNHEKYLTINDNYTFYELETLLEQYDSLEKVTLKEIKIEDKNALESKYPNLEIDALVKYNIYGKEYLENTLEINLSDITVDNNITEYLSYFPNLEKADFGNNYISKSMELALVEKYPKVNFIWNVDVLGMSIKSDIKELNLSNKKIFDLIDFKNSLKLLPNLEKLDMSNTNLTNEELGLLREEFPNIKIDWVVYFGRWSLRTDAIAFSTLVTDTRNPRVDSKDTEVLKYCKDLQALDLGHQALDNLEVIGTLTNLRVLILADNKVTDITPLKNLKHLHYLELFMNKITDITPLKDLPLVDLNLCLNYKLNDITVLYDMKTLERFWATKTSISNDSINNLKRSNPNLQIVTVGEKSTDSGWRTHIRYYALLNTFRNNSISEEFTKYD